jgi:hypothetical protein
MVFLWAGWGIQIVSPLVPVLAVLIHRRSGRYLSLPWMRRLAILVCFQLAVNWAMLGPGHEPGPQRLAGRPGASA